MLQHHTLPSHDIFTYTVPSHVWTDHEYLSEVIMALLWQAGGAVAISVAFGVVTWLGFWWIYRASDGDRRPYVIIGLAIVLGVLAGGPIWGPRDQMISFALACLELLWIRRYLAGRSRALRWFPLLMVLWANLHSGWAIAFVILAIALLSEALMWVWDRGYEHVRHLRTLGIVTALAVVAVAATPHGLALYPYPFQTQFSTAQQLLIAEWRSPDFHDPHLYPFLVLVLVLMVGYAWRRPRLYDLLLAVVLLALALHSVRQITLFVAAVIPGLVDCHAEIWSEVQPRLGAWFAGTGSRQQPRVFSVITALFLVVVALATGTRIADGLRHQGQAVAADYPVAASDWMAAHPDLLGTRMYNQYGWGGYLVYRFYPDRQRRVFIFGEAALMGDQFLYQYQDIQTLQPNWMSLLDKYGVDYVVYNRGQPLDNVLRGEHGWKRVYEDSVAVIYVRQPTT